MFGIKRTPNMIDPMQLVAQLQSTWGSKTAEAFRRESELHPEGGVFESMRHSDGRRMVLIACVTRRDHIDQVERKFPIRDDGRVEDWTKLTILDLAMRGFGHGISFECLRDAEGNRSAMIFVATDPRSISMLEGMLSLNK